MASKKCLAGHEKCPGTGMNCKITPERAAEIRAEAKSGRNWAEEAAYGAACTCGAGLRTFQAARAFQGRYGRPTGFCSRHPGGSVMRKSDWEK